MLEILIYDAYIIYHMRNIFLNMIFHFKVHEGLPIHR